SVTLDQKLDANTFVAQRTTYSFFGHVHFTATIDPQAAPNTVSLVDPDANDTLGKIAVIGRLPANVVPLAGNFTGQASGADTGGLYDPAKSVFMLKNVNSPGAPESVFNYGPAGAGLTPLVGDWTGQVNGATHAAVDTVGLYDPASSTFLLKNSNTIGNADIAFSYGAGGHGLIPLAGDWTGQSNSTTGAPIDTVGLYDPATSTFLLKNSNSPGNADIAFTF